MKPFNYIKSEGRRKEKKGFQDKKDSNIHRINTWEKIEVSRKYVEA